MRLNKFIALNTSLSRRSADEAILQNRVLVNGLKPSIGQQVGSTDTVELDNTLISGAEIETVLIMLNKPVGFVCSRDGQGSQTVYELLPSKYQSLQTVGRLDKDSSGLILLTNDGILNNQLSHPSSNKTKIYTVETDREISPQDLNKINNNGVDIGDKRLSVFGIQDLDFKNTYQIKISEGRNRQIRRTLKALGYNVKSLNRTNFAEYELGNLKPGSLKVL